MVTEPHAILDMTALTYRQREVLGQIACNQDLGHPEATLLALAQRGLIVGHRRPLDDDGHPPVVVTRWELPVAVHVQWCAWCAAQPEEETGVCSGTDQASEAGSGRLSGPHGVSEQNPGEARRP